MAAPITREELKQKMNAREDFVLIDVLSRESYHREHLPGATNIPFGEISKDSVSAIPRDREVIVYCANFECTASPAAARMLEGIGFTNVIDYEGGIADWKEARYPVEPGRR
jgi:rhodanese-related sulfurtransferase